MTIQEAISQVDEMKPNMMSAELKMKYLTEIEQLIHAEIVLKHAHPAEWNEKPKYTTATDKLTVLRVPDPYSDVYVKYIISQIDIQNQEDGRYAVDRAQFESAYNTMSDWWTRTYMPVRRVREFMI